MTEQQQVPNIKLQDLPAGVINTVIGILDLQNDHQSLGRLARTCRRMAGLISWNSPKRAHLKNLFVDLTAIPDSELADAIEVARKYSLKAVLPSLTSRLEATAQPTTQPKTWLGKKWAAAKEKRKVKKAANETKNIFQMILQADDPETDISKLWTRALGLYEPEALDWLLRFHDLADNKQCTEAMSFKYVMEGKEYSKMKSKYTARSLNDVMKAHGLPYEKSTIAILDDTAIIRAIPQYQLRADTQASAAPGQTGQTKTAKITLS